MTTYTVGELIARTFDLLLGAEREDLNQLAASINASATKFTVKFSPPPKVKDYLAIDTEVMWVSNATTSSPGASTVTVIRGMKGTVAATHAATALIAVNPFFTKYQVRKTLQDEIRSWEPQVYAVKTLLIPATDYVRGYDLGAIAPFFDVIDVRIGPDTLYGDISDKDWISVPFNVIQQGPTATFPSGNGLVITSVSGVYDTPRTFHVRYAAPFSVDTAFTDATTILSTVGLDIAEVDIPPYGAAWRLASSREMRRLLTQAMGQVADLQAYPPGYAVGAAEKFKVFRDGRLADAQARIMWQYPLKRTPS